MSDHRKDTCPSSSFVRWVLPHLTDAKTEVQGPCGQGSCLVPGPSLLQHAWPWETEGGDLGTPALCAAATDS